MRALRFALLALAATLMLSASSTAEEPWLNGPLLGDRLCSDGFICPEDTECHISAGDGLDRCKTPGSIMCMFETGTIYCEPDSECDYVNRRCGAASAPPDKTCPDGVTTCPADRECNMEGIGTERCLIPGSTKCEISQGNVTWCRPGLVCDRRQAKCSEPVEIPPGFTRCDDGLTTCRPGLVCNAEGLDIEPCIVPGAHRCEFSAGNVKWCAPGLVCDNKQAKCSEPVTVPPGHKACPDQLTTCPLEQECNPEGPALGYSYCITPGSTRCPISGGVLWCKPGTVCNPKRAECSQPVTVPPGHKLCADQLNTCPLEQECNPEGPALGYSYCIAPGSTRCQYGPGNVAWCKPGTVCDLKQAKCSEPVAVPPGHKACPDQLTTCPLEQECNPEGVGLGYSQCIAPGSTRCEINKNHVLWCKPGQTCDVARAMCAGP